MKIYKISQSNTLTFFHGSMSGENDNQLHSFINNGIDTTIAKGYGQGAGFYVFTSREAALNHIDFIEDFNLGGVPMIIKFSRELTPEEFDVDYEANVPFSVGVITDMWDIFKKTPDKKIYTTVNNTTMVWGGKYQKYSGNIYILPSKSSMKILGNYGGKEVKEIKLFYILDNGIENSIRVKSNDDGNVEDAAIYGSVCNYLESTYPQNFMEKEKKSFDKISNAISQNSSLGYVLKYDGPSISINAAQNMEILFNNQWISGQQYLDKKKEDEKNKVDEVNSQHLNSQNSDSKPSEEV